MSAWTLGKSLAVLVPIVGLILLGLAIAARSGLERAGDSSQSVRLWLENLGRAAVYAVGCVGGLLLIQHVLGAPLGID